MPARPSRADGPALREQLGRAQLMLIYTPEVARDASRAPLEILDAVLGEVDVVQVRVKLPGQHTGPSPARALYDETLAVLELVASRPGIDPLVLVNDRPDVAAALAGRGLAGVHLGQDDLAPRAARALLGDELLIGLSTHTVEQVGQALLEPVDYLGFGPVFATATKAVERGLGPEATWVAASASARPLFPIGGIDAENCSELAPVGRAAVSAAILTATDPARAARSLRELLANAD